MLGADRPRPMGQQQHYRVQFREYGQRWRRRFLCRHTSSLANIIKAEKEEDRYCIQFNNGSGKLYSIELIATEKDPGDVNIDFTKGLDTDGTRILDGNGNEFVMRGLNGAWANLDEDFAKFESRI